MLQGFNCYEVIGYGFTAVDLGTAATMAEAREQVARGDSKWVVTGQLVLRLLPAKEPLFEGEQVLREETPGHFVVA